jgi:anti-anti-sigma factor
MRMARIAAMTAKRAHYTRVAVCVASEVTTITVCGRVVCGVHFADFLLEATRRAAARNTRVISINLRKVYQIDAAGIGVLAFAYSIAKDAGIHFELLNTPRFVIDLLKICKLDCLVMHPPPADEREMYESAA